MSPVWLAVIKQEPAVNIVTVVPETEHTETELEVSVTVSPRLEVAVTINSLFPRMV